MAKKPKLTRAQEEQKKAKSVWAQYNINTPAKKKHIINVLLPIPNNTTTIPVITPRKNTPTKDINTKNNFLWAYKEYYAGIRCFCNVGKWFGIYYT